MNATHTISMRRDVVAALRETRDLEDDSKLAAAMGVHPSTVSRVMSGKSQPGPAFQAGLCIALGAKLDHLFRVSVVEEGVAA